MFHEYAYFFNEYIWKPVHFQVRRRSSVPLKRSRILKHSKSPRIGFGDAKIA